MAETFMGFQLSPQQERLWLLRERDVGTAAYRAECVVTLRGDVKRQRLEEAVARVVERYEILRTCFRSQAGMFLPLQVITPDQSQLDVALVSLSPVEHTLTITLPSACADHESLRQIVREIKCAYANEASDDEPVQYKVVSQWFNDVLESEDAQIGKDYWHDQRPSESTVVKLPFQREDSAPFEWTSISSVVPRALVAKIEQFIAQHETTPRAFFLTCWHALLYRLTGEANVTIGTCFDGRSDADLTEALGLFARYLPVRSHIEDSSSFVEVLTKIDQAVAQSYDWQECFTWEQTSEPYFPFCFDYDEQPSEYNGGDVTFSIIRQHACIDRFDLKLACLLRNDSLVTEFYFDPLIFEQRDIERLAEEFQALLESVVENPRAAIRQLNILGETERHKLLVELNDTQKPYPRESCLHELFEQQAARTPDNVAVTFRDEQITFATLNARSNQLARHLQAHGVSTESLVAICMERSTQMVVSLLAILKADAAYVPLDPESPAERQASILRDIQATVVLTQQSLLASLPEWDATIVYPDTESFGNYSDENLIGVATSSNLAYVIFTSGSTGTPKGVMISHRAICNHMAWLVEHFGLHEHDTILQKTPYFFDASVTEFFAPLITGGRLVLAEPGGHRDPAYMVSVMARTRVTTLQVVPSMLRALLEEPGFAHVSSLKRVICAGEALSLDLRDKFKSSLSARLYNLYGPTEAAIDVTSWDCALEVQRKTVPIGGPIANTRVYVLDSALNPVPFGAPGELYLGGDGLARGYLNRPELTAERFIPDPFSMVDPPATAGGTDLEPTARLDKPGARLYKTGDLVRYLPENVLEFLSRSDEQVKIRGFRIEPGEIEAVLNQHKLVRQAVVTVDEDEHGTKRLVAYVLPKNVSRLPNGLQIVQLNEHETPVLYDEIFNQNTYLKHGVTLADGDCVFDVGANIGMFTLFVHQQCSNPKVYSFEPVPATFEVLKSNVELYKLNAEVFNCGLSKHNGMTKVTFYPQMSSMSGFYADRVEDEQVSRAFVSNQDARLHRFADELLDGKFRSETFDCTLTTISDVIDEQQIETIDLLKVDAEKSELDILDGIRKDDWKKIRQIVLEVHDVEGRLDAITEILRRQGFRFVVEQDPSQTNTDLYNIYAVHPSRARKATPNSGGDVFTRTSVPGISNSELRTYVEERLPAYMVPSTFIKLGVIPTLPSGKINRKALPAPDWTRTETDNYVAPRTPVETQLADIWKRTLGLEQVCVYDSFFALGGDSILGIQLIAKANQAGLRLTIKQLFQHKTIAALSEVVGLSALKHVEVEQSGPVPLTPAQHWFFEQQLAEQHHFNQSVLVEVQPAEPRVFEEIFKHLLQHHDVLQRRYVYQNGAWQISETNDMHRTERGSAGSTSQLSALNAFEYEDLSAYSIPEQQSHIESRATALQSSLNLQNGPLMRAVVFNRGAGRPSVLLMVIHHLVVDGISWRILTEDFETAYRQHFDSRPIQLPPKTTSFNSWSRRLAEYAQSQEVQNELAYWLDEARAAAPVLPVDFVLGDNTVASTNTISVSLNAEGTAALLHDVPAAYNTQINDVLLTALVLAFSNWTRSSSLLVDIEGHGRETIDDETDISRTVGWFTSIFPMLFEIPESGEPGDALKSIKEQLRQVPNRGFGYGLLRYLNADSEVRTKLSSLPQSEVAFNYLGQFDRSDTNDSIIGATLQTSAPTRSLRGVRRHLLEINGSVSEGQLRLSWIYSTNRHERETIERLANDFIEMLQSLVDHCLNLEERGYTPSDFPEADLDQAELDELIASLSGSITIQESV